MRFMSVDLPEPEGPMIATYSPRADLEADPAQGVDLFRAHDVGAPEVLGQDQRPVAGDGHGRCAHERSLLALVLELDLGLVACRVRRVLKEPVTISSPSSTPSSDLDVGVADDAGLDRLEDRLVLLHHEDAVLLLDLLLAAPRPGVARLSSRGLASSGSTILPSLSTSRTTTAWMGTASTFSRRAVVMSAVALRPGRRVGGGSLRVIVTLKSLAWLPVLPAVELCCAAAAVEPRTTAEEPISVTSPLMLDALERVHPHLGRLPELHVADVGLVDHDLALHHRQVGHGHDHGGAEALGPDHDLALFLGQARDDAVHGRDDRGLARGRRRVLSSWAWSWAIRRRGDSTAACFILTSASAWS